MKPKTPTIIALAILLTLSLLTPASALTIDNVESNPSTVQPGDKVQVVLDIENNLDEDAKNVIVMLDLTLVPFAPYESSNEVVFEELDEGKSKNARFELIASSDASSGTYKIPVLISYKESGNVEEQTSGGLISLIINAQPRLDVSVEDGILIKGKINKISIKIVNSGLGEARLLSLSLDAAAGLSVIGSNEDYIGNIESDDFDNAEFQVSIKDNAGSKIGLPIQVKYRDSRNKEFTETKYVFLDTYTTDEAIELGLMQKSNTLTYVIVVIILVIVWWIWKRRKKRKKEKKEA